MNSILSKIQQFVITLSKIDKLNQKTFLDAQRNFSKDNSVQFYQKDKILKAYRELVNSGVIEKNNNIEKVLRIKRTRSMSGIVVVSVLTKAYECPGKCLYCPSEKDVPKSYLSDEPAVMRAITCNYDPYKQVMYRLKALDNTGHKTSKINIRVIGGTWSFYPKQYQTWFIKECFRACNDFGRTETMQNHTLYELQTENESAQNKIVEISVETRQDYIDEKEILRLRQLGVTKVELGIQSIYDDVLKFNNRGHDMDQTIKSISLLKDAGFKISYQVMLNLPKSNYQRDLKMIKEIFSNKNFKPDYIKIYPLALVKSAPIYNLYLEKKFKPYSEHELKELLKECKKNIPYYCRVERVIRDIPSQHIVEGGSKISNLRQTIIKELETENTPCKCIRCREIRDYDSINNNPKLFRMDYDSSNGKEIFLSYETSDRKYLYSMLRLRINENPLFDFLKNSSLVREIHTYGDQVAANTINIDASQHTGFGAKLLKEAERISKNEFQLNKISVISGVGVRNYFRKFGYELDNTYMSKKL